MLRHLFSAAGESDVISQVDRLSSTETKIAARSVRIAVGAWGRAATICMIASRVRWVSNRTLPERRRSLSTPHGSSMRSRRGVPSPAIAVRDLTEISGLQRRQEQPHRGVLNFTRTDLRHPIDPRESAGEGTSKVPEGCAAETGAGRRRRLARCRRRRAANRRRRRSLRRARGSTLSGS